MLVIKTIVSNTTADFDTQVNGALTEGWEIVKRECLGFDHTPLYYAELERVIDEPIVEIDEDLEEDPEEDVAQWLVTRNPRNPYKCSSCGYTANLPWGVCPQCKTLMLNAEE